MNTEQAFTFGWTLLHFLWQGTMIALILWIVLAFARRTRPELRYLIACTGLALMALTPLATFMVLQPKAPAIALNYTSASPQDVNSESQMLSQGSPNTIQVTSRPVASVFIGWRGRLNQIAPSLLPLWALGVLLLSLRLAGGISWLARARQRSQLLEGEWNERVEILRCHFGVARNIALRVLDEVEGPIVSGILKPIILVPASILTGLPAAQVELLLAHEIAHVARHDVLANAIQRGVETLLFFHPAVWWLGRRVRQERERCCDAMAANFLGDPCGMAEALTSLADFHRMPTLPTFALGAADGSLGERVRALLGFHAPFNRIRAVIAGGLILACLGTGFGLYKLRTHHLADRSRKAAASSWAGHSDQAGYVRLLRYGNDLRVEFEVQSGTAAEVLAAFARAETRMGKWQSSVSERIQYPKPAKDARLQEFFTVRWRSLNRPQFLEYWYRLKTRPPLACPADTLVVRRDNLELPWDNPEDPALDIWVPKYADQLTLQGARLLRDAILEIKALVPTPSIAQEVRKRLPDAVLASLKSPEPGMPILRDWNANRDEALFRLCREGPYVVEGGFSYDLNLIQLDLKSAGASEKKAMALLEETLIKHREAEPPKIYLQSRKNLNKRSRANAYSVTNNPKVVEEQEQKIKIWREQEQKIQEQIYNQEKVFNQKALQSAMQHVQHRLLDLGIKEPIRAQKLSMKIELLQRQDGSTQNTVLVIKRLKLDPAILRMDASKEVNILRMAGAAIQASLDLLQKAPKTVFSGNQRPIKKSLS
jgi:beta-lactamase regulating signal transducer with metallopeptidase domain